MSYYAINIDLVAKNSHRRLAGELVSLGAIQTSTCLWLMERRKKTNAFSVRDYLAQFLGADDRLVVIEFTKEPAYYNPLGAGAKWIEDRKNRSQQGRL